MIKGLMVHEQLANYFDFLGLDGFREEQDCHYIDESRRYRELCHFYTNHYNSLISIGQVEDPKLIPQSWYKYTRFDVDTNTKENGVENGFKQWKDWELSTRSLLVRFYKELENMSEISSCLFLKQMIRSVDHELHYIDDMILKMKSTGYDLVYINELQRRFS